MRVLLTGARGFTGGYVRAELEAHGHSVVGLAADLTHKEALTAEVAALQPEAVVHLAALAFVGHGNPNAFYEVNLIGTRNLLAALAEYAPAVQSVLLASSANVYGNRSEGVLSESTLPDPVNDYAVSKLAMEQMAALWADELPLFIVRPFNYTGVGQDEKFLIPKIVAHFKRQQAVIELGNLAVWRDFGDVRDVARAYRELLAVCPRGQTINVCSGHTYTLQDIIDFCTELSGHHLRVQVNPAFVRPNEVRVLSGDNSRLKQLLTNSAAPSYTLKETLSWMLQSR